MRSARCTTSTSSGPRCRQRRGWPSVPRRSRRASRQTRAPSGLARSGTRRRQRCRPRRDRRARAGPRRLSWTRLQRTACRACQLRPPLHGMRAPRARCAHPIGLSCPMADRIAAPSRLPPPHMAMAPIFRPPGIAGTDGRYDAVVVVFCLLDVLEDSFVGALLQDRFGLNFGQLSFLRCFRLLRVFKLARSWKGWAPAPPPCAPRSARGNAADELRPLNLTPARRAPSLRPPAAPPARTGSRASSARWRTRWRTSPGCCCCCCS